MLHSYTAVQNNSKAEMPNYSNKVSFLLCTEKEEQGMCLNIEHVSCKSLRSLPLLLFALCMVTVLNVAWSLFMCRMRHSSYCNVVNIVFLLESQNMVAQIAVTSY